MRIGTMCIVVGGLSVCCGCQGTVTCSDVEQATADSNANGFPDVTPPAGVAFDGEHTVKVFAANTLVPADLAPFAQEHGADPNLVGIAEFLVRFSFKVGYPNGATQQICQSFPFDAFETRFEAVCPETTEMEVDIIALVPALGIPIATIPVGFTLDAVDYACGDTISIVTTKDELGRVV